ncbi:rhodanese-related sulfurtransferase [Frigoribacterium sp. VKM Ac-2836]|uniref:oxygen-dependent tRNA uridine(34) hydroxylase TrhO n=1 Tax=Frigoribacterium sp. VKM Ac-2836 TaxID=2739014 RepID=UPI0015665D29|nr:rhodanese-related sulfurtransferase [Frigoribacterium sp. VKM Ac-2836]NRD26451.1 rhodanese-related sulfurtransferase [Frigoribacterium sp. VKM Ac-2836]
MATPKIVLFYVFTPLADPEAIRLWQRDLAESLDLTGRVLVSTQGVNGTLGGDLPDVKRWLKKTRQHPALAQLDVKWSEGTGSDFPRLSVKVRDEIVTFGAPDELEVDESGVVGTGERLSPDELHELVDREQVTFFDGRNEYESRIGRFRDAVVPDVATTRDFVAELDSGRYDHLKDEPVVTYCTGGVRCEVLSSLMTARGFSRVYQLDGGVVRYGERFGDDGLWDGSLYVFDGRGSVEFSDHAAVIGHCETCGTATSRMQNCVEVQCREQLVACEGCGARGDVTCDRHRASGPVTVGGPPAL